jgi:hypothetical protein
MRSRDVEAELLALEEAQDVAERACRLLRDMAWPRGRRVLDLRVKEALIDEAEAADQEDGREAQEAYA